MSGDEEEPLRVYFIDGSFKSVPVIPNETTIEELWDIVGDKLGLTVDVAQNFFIWGIQGDLEMLLYADSTIAEVRAEWPKYHRKYSNDEKLTKRASRMLKSSFLKRFSRATITETEEPAGLKFTFKPTCIVPIRVERNVKSVEAIDLFYKQAVHNMVKSNYPTDIDTALQLAAFQMQVTVGDRDPEIHKPGYLGPDILKYIPEWYHEQRGHADWEALVYVRHDLNRGKDKLICQMLYLQLVRQYSYYGSTVFAAKYTPPGQGFFHQEFSGDMKLGVNGEGIHIIDFFMRRFYSVPFEKIAAMESDGKYFWFTERTDTGLAPLMHTVKTRQSDLIEDLVHDWFGEWKRTKQQLDAERFRQNSQRLLSIAIDDTVHRPETFEDKIVTDYYAVSGLTSHVWFFQNQMTTSGFDDKATGLPGNFPRCNRPRKGCFTSDFNECPCFKLFPPNSDTRFDDTIPCCNRPRKRCFTSDFNDK
eukprot:TRINITY_DN7636_c0_g1_i2.p1 TRINITY_DN7636_c0_g1~~TRINITY_DN7636_c0_g1_i2.p1  ORF type:complete len:491 (-),score=86.42 TRINITY_DN7636_c0_g1_i2:41-1462(-)